MKYVICCARFEEALDWGDIVATPLSPEMYGEPEPAEKGDGLSDDETRRFTIEFCPFCGKKITAQETEA